MPSVFAEVDMFTTVLEDDVLVSQLELLDVISAKNVFSLSFWYQETVSYFVNFDLHLMKTDSKNCALNVNVNIESATKRCKILNQFVFGYTMFQS